jgi:hypothetical protein
LLGQSKKADDMSRVSGLDNQGIVGLQRQIMKGSFIFLNLALKGQRPNNMQFAICIKEWNCTGIKKKETESCFFTLVAFDVSSFRNGGYLWV